MFFKKLISVIKSEINNHTKPIYVRGRHSDAFVYILSGSCSYSFDDGRVFTVNQGDILYLAHNADYTMNIHTPSYRFIYCDFEFDGEDLRESNVYSLIEDSDSENLFRRLYKKYKTFSEDSFAECMSLLYTIYGIILRTQSKDHKKQSVEGKIGEAKEYIDTHFTDVAISVTALAEQTGMSEVYFRKLFKKQYNVSPSQYIISVRIKKAKQLLNYSFLTLEKCALQSGFSSVQYFCRVFKTITGITPSEYRNNKLKY
ncbi:MAG: helix-turn-helix transcriptional regulator [Clostridia bacterium]|nr:helix-turn-helix transcriptional regulator [Clostridia bacterium]